MERLTERELYDGKVCFTKCAKTNCQDKCVYCDVQKEAYARLKEYEDLEERGELLLVPEISKGKTLYWIWDGEIMPVIFKKITGCVVDNNGRPHIMCEMRTKKDKTFIRTSRGKQTKDTYKAGDRRYFYSEDIGKTVFFTKREAEAELKAINNDGNK